MNDAIERTTTPPLGRSAGTSGLAWRRTWPFGAADDFVADLAGGGWARIRRVRDVIGRDHWQWSFAGRDIGGGEADTRDGAERALTRMC
jgi:hypothetical protein